MGNRKHVVNLMFTITLLGVFALAAIFVAMMGAQVYSHSADKMKANFDTRTSLVYIAEKMRQSKADAFEVRKTDEGADALVLSEQYKDRTFETWIYSDGGKLHEIMAEKGKDISAIEGQIIMDVHSLGFTDDGRTVTITVINSKGEEESLTIGRRAAA